MEPAEARPLPELTSDPMWRLTDRVLSVTVMIAVAAIWYYFSG